MRIAIIGTHCSGKSTLCSKIYSNILFEGYEVTQEPMRHVYAMGFNANMEADDAAQLAMLSIHLKNLIFDNVVTDRSVIDSYIYAKYIHNIGGPVSSLVVEFIEKMMYSVIHKYDYVFLCEPDFELSEDGFRSNDIKFRDAIHNMFVELCGELKKNLKINIINLKGDCDKRLDTIVNVAMLGKKHV